MIDAEPNCPTVPNPRNGTVGQRGKEWDSTRDRGGTISLKRLAAVVLARDSGWDKARSPARTAVPLPPSPVPTGTALVPSVLGVPAAWCEGIMLLPTLPPPDGLTPARWAAFASTGARLLRDHGTALHGAGWDALDLFGLHRTHPATNPAGWGLAWLLDQHGDVLDVSADAVGMRRGPDGARLAFRRRAGRAGVVPAWAVPWNAASSRPG